MLFYLLLSINTGARRKTKVIVDSHLGHYNLYFYNNWASKIFILLQLVRYSIWRFTATLNLSQLDSEAGDCIILQWNPHSPTDINIEATYFIYCYLNTDCKNKKNWQKSIQRIVQYQLSCLRWSNLLKSLRWFHKLLLWDKRGRTQSH